MSAISLSQPERGPGSLFLSCLPRPRSLPKQEPPCSRGEGGGGRITCCEQHFCPAPSRWGQKLAVLGNLSSYCWLHLSGASKETEEGGQRGRVPRLQGRAERGPLGAVPRLPVPAAPLAWEPLPALPSTCCAFNVSRGRRGCAACLPACHLLPTSINILKDLCLPCASPAAYLLLLVRAWLGLLAPGPRLWERAR